MKLPPVPVMAGVLSLFACIVCLAVFFANPVEFFLLDAQIALTRLFSDPYEVSRDIAIVMIDEKSSREFGLDPDGRWSPLYIRLLDVLRGAEAGVIAFDIQMGRKDDEGFTALAEAFRKAGNVITGEIRPLGTLREIASSVRAIGSFSVLSYAEVPRKVMTYPFQPVSRKAFSVLVASQYAELTGKGRGTALPEEGFWINYRYPLSHFPVFSFSDVYEARDGRLRDGRRTPVSVFRGRIVIVAKESDRFLFPN
jgi:CHASE2 domain-containing sensor protein